MKTKFNFNSQICTTREQSEHLLALGLKKETADMYWLDHALTEDYEDWRITPIYNDWEEWQKYGIPAWSLHRLLMMTTNKRKVMLIRCESDLYDVVIKKIEREINEGNFNKEYLEIKE